LRILLRFFLGLFGLFFIGLIVFAVMVYSADLTKYKAEVLKKFNDKTGMHLDIRGSIEFVLQPQPKIKFTHVVFKSESTSPGYMLKAQQLSIDFTWQSVFSKDTTDYKFQMNDGLLRLTDRSKKETNYPFQKMGGNLRYADSVFNLKDLNYITADNALQGDLVFKRNKRSSLSGNIVINNWKMISNDSEGLIPNNFHHTMNLNLGVKVKELMIDNTKFKNVVTHLTVNKDKLKLAPFKLKLGGGTLDVGFTAEGKDLSNLFINLRGNQIRLTSLMKGPTQNIEGGVMKFIISGHSKGDTLQQILASFNGDALFQLGATTIKNNKKIKTSEGFVFSIFAFANPFQSRSKDTQVQCAVAKMVVQDGIAYLTPGLGIQTRDANVLGEGRINLAKQTVNLRLGLDNKSALSLQVGSFDNVLKITGSLGDPKYTVSGASVVAEGGSILAAIATGGLSLIAQKAIEVTSKVSDPCGVVLRGHPKVKPPSDKRRD